MNPRRKREPWLRLSVECYAGRDITCVADVGPTELAGLVRSYDKVVITAWGVYGDDGWRHNSLEHIAIVHTMEG